MSLITAQQIIKKSPAESNLPTDLICKNLNKYVRAAFRDCLGYELLELLEADKISYASAVKWDEDSTYADGKIVMYDDEPYVFNLVEVEDEIVTPDCSANWSQPDVFMSDCYNALYPYLCEYLALYVYGRVLPFLRYKTSALGSFIQADDGNKGEALSTKDFSSYTKYINMECNECLEELKEWIKCQHEGNTCDFSCVPFLMECGTECKDEVSNTGGRFGWRY